MPPRFREFRGAVSSESKPLEETAILGDVIRSPADPRPAREALSTRAFFDGGLTLLLGAMLALRLRIHAGTPLPSTQPLSWLGLGLLEDLAIAGFVSALLLSVGQRTRTDGWTWALLAAFALLMVTAEAVWSEVLVFFGQLPSRDEIAAGMNFTFARGTARGFALGATAAFLLVFASLLALAARRAKRAGRAWSTSGRLFLLAAIAAGASLLLPVSVHRQDTARGPLVALASIWAEHSGNGEEAPSLVLAPGLDPASIRSLWPNVPAGAYLSSDFPLAHRPPRRSSSAPRAPGGLRPNLVFLLLESVRAEEVGAYGKNPPGVTPNLDRLAREGVLVERAYSVGLQTTDAELAFWYGVSPNPNSSLMTAHPGVRLNGLPEILRASGWRSFLWIHNGDQTFYRRDRFYRPRGFQMIDGRDFPRNDPRTGWGYSDRALARRAIEALDRAREPFAALALTVSNHHPFHVPADAQSHFPLLPGPRRGFLSFLGIDQRMGLQTAPMLQTVHYTDEAVGEFLRLASSRKWFPRTVFVIAGDHGLSIVPYRRKVETLPALTELRHRVPLILYSPLIAPSRVAGPASQADVFETFLGFAGIDVPRSGTGRDLLDPNPGDPDPPVVLWSAPGRLVTVVDRKRLYQASVSPPSSDGAPGRLSDEVLIDPASDPQERNDRLPSEPEVAERYRRLAQTYVDLYPWLLLSGRSGVPESVSAGAAR